jgi:hypothetical protein
MTVATATAEPYKRDSVSVYDERRKELEKHEFMTGLERGRLAVSRGDSQLHDEKYAL